MKEASSANSQQLQRHLKNRHIQLIAISGAIGTGLFMGSGKTISLAGPSIILVYMIIGFMLFFVMRAMGEILLSNLQYKSFRDFTTDLLGPMAGFFTGWTYWFCWIVTGIADIIAIASYTHYWFPELASWIPMVLCILLFLCLNLLTVRLFGETEFWFSILKIITIVALITIGTFLVIIAFQSPITGDVAKISNLWAHGGFFPNGMMGFFAGFQIAVFAFVGIELAGTTAAETEDPESTLPKAINSIPIRIIIFYVFALIAIMCVTPWTHVEADKSPFVTMFALVGIPAAAGIINFVVLTSAASSANSGIYSTSRMLYGLAHENSAPKILGRLSVNHVPSAGLLFSCICLLGGVVINVLFQDNIIGAFTLVTTISAILFIFIWSMILISYLVYYKRSPQLHQQSKFKMPGNIFMCYATLIFLVLVIIMLTFETDTRLALMYTPLWFIGLAITYFSYFKKRAKTFNS